MTQNFQKKNIKNVKVYTTSRDLFKSGLFFDSNENYRQWVKIDWRKIKKLNCYPDNHNEKLADKLIKKYLVGFKPENIYVGAGSIEIIQTIFMGFADSDDWVMILDPSYSIYQFQASITNVKCKKVLMKSNFKFAIGDIQSKDLGKVKILFICSPNNPTGQVVARAEIEKILKFYRGLVVIDEAYIEFAGLDKSLVRLVKKYNNVIILRTFSKAWGLAGLRVGYGVADKKIISVLNKIRNPYNVSKIAQEIIVQALSQKAGLKETIIKNKKLKQELVQKLRLLGFVVRDTEANFILLEVNNASKVYNQLGKNKIIVRDCSQLSLMNGFLRITVSSRENNRRLVQALKNICKD